jgi:hypothetical protein
MPGQFPGADRFPRDRERVERPGAQRVAILDQEIPVHPVPDMLEQGEPAGFVHGEGFSIGESAVGPGEVHQARPVALSYEIVEGRVTACFEGVRIMSLVDPIATRKYTAEDLIDWPDDEITRSAAGVVQRDPGAGGRPGAARP